MKTNDNKVIKVQIDVEAFANLGIFNSVLFNMIKLTLAKTANTMASINFQLKISRMMFSMFSRFPDINFLSPNKTMEKVLAKQ